MRIQHNITAMNSYRNYSANNSKLSKNLEKLSTGYKINRAGDDAAGLAISEKMRAQITGLEGATKNAKDGISLIQTAEGALTEVHDMLNRMTTLAEQSANGTYDNELDRAQLQKEVQALKDEIDRIADSTNYNGLKLLDGSLSTSGKQGVTADLSKLGVDVLSTAETVAAQKGVYTTNFIGGAAAAADSVGENSGKANTQFNLTLNYTDTEGKEQSITKTIRLTEDTATTGKPKWVLEDGTDDGVAIDESALTTNGQGAGTVSAKNLAEAFKAVLDKDADVKSNFKVAVASDGKLEFSAIAPGSDGAKLTSMSLTSNAKTTPDNKTTYAAKVDASPLAEDAQTIYNMASAKVWNNDIVESSTAASNDNQTRDLDEAIMEINGKKFVFVNTDPTEDDLKKMSAAGVDQWVKIASADGDPANADIQEMARRMAKETGLTVEVGGKAANNTTVDGIVVKQGAWQKGKADTFVLFKDAEGTTKGGLKLQIGDTSDSYNKLTVSVEDMHAKTIGIGNVDISTQDGAAAALDQIKSAINYVSDTRGNLGALQNRLDHTINNLGVMRENIQNAESNIRDTDVAEEMMVYTKNNILNQSAQAMLAQANQLPQGVLQLLG